MTYRDLNSPRTEDHFFEGEHTRLSPSDPPVSIGHPAGIDLSLFPKTRYYGSKRRLVPWITTHLSKLEFNSALDLFGGTATVSLLMQALQKKVAFNDSLNINKAIAPAILSAQFNAKRSREALFHALSKIRPYKGLISKTYAGLFYTDKENNWLDGAFAYYCKNYNTFESSVFLYCLAQACLQKRPFNLFHRANLNLRTTYKGATRKFYNHVTWERPFEELMLRSFEELARIPPRWRSHETEYSALDTSEATLGSDLLYVDPPYIPNKKRPESYLSLYSFLEGFSRGEDWPGCICLSSKLRTLNQSTPATDWADKNEFLHNLSNLISARRYRHIVMSYSKGGPIEASSIEKTLRERYYSVARHDYDISHALAKHRKTELLFLASDLRG